MTDLIAALDRAIAAAKARVENDPTSRAQRAKVDEAVAQGETVKRERYMRGN